MTTQTKNPAHTKKGQKIKFVVSSAEEAVNLIRHEMGEHAKVLSVRQVEGKGLAKFLTAPKLEVIATLPEEEQATQSATTETQKLTSEEKTLLDEPAQKQHFSPSFSHSPFAKETTPTRTGKATTEANRLETVLRSAGFDNATIRRFEHSTDWEKLQRMPIRTALGDLARRLRLDYDAIKVPATTLSIAFVGTSGAGKTTALCKQLAHEVFFERRSVQVFKLDGNTPNADTALGLYCEVMGVPLIREAKLLSPTAATLIDTSGVNQNDPEEIAELKKKLDQMGVKTRVWTVNAAYDNHMIDRGFATADELGATHAVYTHLDEINSTSRLWHFVLSGRLPVLFGSTGPGVAHDRESMIGAILLQKTFPEFLLQ